MGRRPKIRCNDLLNWKWKCLPVLLLGVDAEVNIRIDEARIDLKSTRRRIQTHLRLKRAFAKVCRECDVWRCECVAASAWSTAIDVAGFGIIESPCIGGPCIDEHVR